MRFAGAQHKESHQIVDVVDLHGPITKWADTVRHPENIPLVEYPLRLWNPDGSKRIVDVDFLPAEIDANYHPQVEVVGDLAHALRMLSERFRRDGVPAYDLDRQRTARADARRFHGACRGRQGRSPACLLLSKRLGEIGCSI